MIGHLVKSIALSAALVLPLSTLSAHAISFDFLSITNGNADEAAIGEAQFSVDVTESGSNVLFSFHNSGPIASHIAQVYFDDTTGVLGSYVGEINIEIEALGGVNFEPDNVTPPVLPGGNEAGFSSDLGFDAGGPENGGGPGSANQGVDAGETLGLILSLAGGNTFQDVIDALFLGTDGLRIGIHGQGLGEGTAGLGGSESFVNTITTVTPVPLPAGGVLLITGLLALTGLRRRANNQIVAS